MKRIILFIMTIVLSGCLPTDRIDTSRLKPLHRLLFAEAAAREDVEVTKHGQPGNWVVSYDYTLPSPYAGYANFDNSNGCRIRINPNRLIMCESGGTDQHFLSVSQHELRHCKEGYIKHSQIQGELMFKDVPCWPIDINL